MPRGRSGRAGQRQTGCPPGSEGPRGATGAQGRKAAHAGGQGDRGHAGGAGVRTARGLPLLFVVCQCSLAAGCAPGMPLLLTSLPVVGSVRPRQLFSSMACVRPRTGSSPGAVSTPLGRICALEPLHAAPQPCSATAAGAPPSSLLPLPPRAHHASKGLDGRGGGGDAEHSALVQPQRLQRLLRLQGSSDGQKKQRTQVGGRRAQRWTHKMWLRLRSLPLLPSRLRSRQARRRRSP